MKYVKIEIIENSKKPENIFLKAFWLRQLAELLNTKLTSRLLTKRKNMPE